MTLAFFGSRSSKRGRGFGLLLLALSTYGLGVGCSGKTNSAEPQTGPHAGNGSATAGVGGSGHAGSVSAGGMAHAGSASHAGSGGKPPSGDAGANAGGEPSENGGASGTGGGGTGGASTSGTGGGNAGWGGVGGASNGKLMCFDGVCGYQCKKDGVIGDPGYDFYVECNKCHCNLDGSPDCETKDCTKDCDWFADEYEGAFGEAQYCMLDNNTIDACQRVQTSSLPCPCAAPVSSVAEFQAVSKKWELKWQAAGCVQNRHFAALRYRQGYLRLHAVANG
jgi:hypothetical protein